MNLDAPLEHKLETVGRLLREIAQRHAPATFANSFGAEDMLLTDLLCRHAPGIEIFSLDTGRLPPETYRLMQHAMRHYHISIRVHFPDYRAVEEYVRSHGPDAFYDSIELRKRCCHIRKVEPLRRALRGKQAWITGLRREQSPSRRDLQVEEWDAVHGLRKFNPLLDWSQDEVWTCIRHFAIPYNELHDKHYPSIGCAPCTRAITVGEDIRAGRWWWEDPQGKECGIHLKETGELK
jgi:phosphoadenosine phosphosulfate reductase